MSELSHGTQVRHARLGLGRVIAINGDLAVVQLPTGALEQVLAEELKVVSSLDERLQRGRCDSPLPTLLRAAALAIRSVNDKWGVFAPSRIALLPHQLWVCRKVLESWPTRWLVADDVGLGKTVEAGLIIDPLISSGRVRRLLVIAPASLVGQWQERMRKMFDIRLTQYVPEADTATADFWNTHRQVVVSIHTIRRDSNERWDRLLEADAWDLVVVDEAHHINAEEDHRTLAYELLSRMEELRRIRSMIFFTGTPHRGKTYGFFALMQLLRPDLFDRTAPPEEQLPRLRNAMIRNNKAQVTDMGGTRLFTPVTVSQKEYGYSAAEQAFYDRLSEYISTGRAFANQLSGASQRRAMLVLITMQKLASSSIAAVKRALTARLGRLQSVEQRHRGAVTRLQRLEARLKERARGDSAEAFDAQSELEEFRAAVGLSELFNPEEIPALQELIGLAEAVPAETKVQRLIELLDSEYSNRSVLLFTEYKATQALVMSALEQRFGDGCVAFINGEGVSEGVVGSDGRPRTVRSERHAVARAFNRGEVRFLVSTEAAGEGIDLQRRCHTLCHIDLPWNPMRLHQRVGRVSRYGQTEPVDVFLFLNPNTVEGQIWQRLFEKLGRITEAFRSGMDDPEDMLQAVLGLATPGFFEQVFADAPTEPRDGLAGWFDSRTATFGGKGAVDYVQRVFGNVARFDFGTAGTDMPRVDLPDLVPFIRGALVEQGRRPEVEGTRISFNTPDAWFDADPLLARTAHLDFARERENIAGVGTKYVDLALASALDQTQSVARIPGLVAPLALVRIEEQLTGGGGAVRQLVFGVEQVEGEWRLVADWQLLLRLNEMLAQPFALRAREGDSAQLPGAGEFSVAALAFFGRQVPAMGLALRAPRAEVASLLWPAG